MRYRRILVLLIFSFLFCCRLHAQNDTAVLVSVNLKEASLEKFAAEIEKQCKFRFYFDTTATDSVVITINVTNQPLKTVLDQAFANSGSFYTIDNERHIFITKDYALRLSLPDGFFTAGKTGKNKLAAGSTVTAGVDDDDEAKPAQKATLENKLYEIGDKLITNPPRTITMAGYVRDAKPVSR